VQHWKEGGHDNLCKKIKKAGGAEQYNANKKYAEAVAVAVEKCADDTKGQTCYICTEALHWKTKEGLVRGCACRGTAGFAHVSCLAEQAKILREQAEENHSDDSQWHRWHTCSLCEQNYYGTVRCALGWACWKTYAGRPETDWARRKAITMLGNGLFATSHFADALSVQEAELCMKRRLGAPECKILIVQCNLATTYHKLGRREKALQMLRDAYFGFLKLHGEEHARTILAANNLAGNLVRLEHYEEARSLMRKTIPVARRVLGEGHDTTLRMRLNYGMALYKDDAATLDDLREAVTTFEDTERTARRVFGGAHPLTEGAAGELQKSRAALREAPRS
jgi:tetratricopeptide (TPR) repeat protein